jgi:cell division septum initiation protein DivIVA
MPPRAGLDGLLSTAPVFHVRLRGYDPFEVDEYVTWAEGEVAAARREAEHLLSRYGACAAELEISRRLLAQTPRGRDVSPVSDRVRDIFRLAADEASAMVEAAAEESEQLLAEARLEADARLRKARQVKEMAAATADEMRELAERDRAETTALLEQARQEADELVGGAVAERDRLAAEAAEARDDLASARAELASARAELADLQRRRDEAGTSLRRLTDQIEAALALATGGPADRFLVVGNTVQSVPATSQSVPVASVPS